VATWIAVWLLIAVVSTAALIAFLIALGRHVLILGRTASRAQEEVAPIAAEISREGSRAAERVQNLKVPHPGSS
jgi:hypothetical protein